MRSFCRSATVAPEPQLAQWDSNLQLCLEAMERLLSQTRCIEIVWLKRRGPKAAHAPNLLNSVRPNICTYLCPTLSIIFPLFQLQPMFSLYPHTRADLLSARRQDSPEVPSKLSEPQDWVGW